MARKLITETLWEELKPLLPAAKGRHGKDDRAFLEGVLWIVRTGAPWRDLPSELGNWQTIYGRYNRWAKKGHLDKILELLKQTKDRDDQWHCIDASVIGAHRHGAGAKGGQDRQDLGRSCGGFSSRIHAKVDSLGFALRIIVTVGQDSDIAQAQTLVGNDLCSYLLGDKGYDSDHFREFFLDKKLQLTS